MEVSLSAVYRLVFLVPVLNVMERRALYERREATEQPYEDWHSSRFVDCGRDFGASLYALFALIVGVMLILHIYLIERRGIL